MLKIGPEPNKDYAYIDAGQFVDVTPYAFELKLEGLLTPTEFFDALYASQYPPQYPPTTKKI